MAEVPQYINVVVDAPPMAKVVFKPKALHAGFQGDCVVSSTDRRDAGHILFHNFRQIPSSTVKILNSTNHFEVVVAS